MERSGANGVCCFVQTAIRNVHKRLRDLGRGKGQKLVKIADCSVVLKICRHGGGGCQYSRKIAYVVSEWSHKPVQQSKQQSLSAYCPNIYTVIALVTQPMSQLRPNRTELRSMDYYHQIFCRFQKCKRKVPPPSLLSNDFEKNLFFKRNF